MVHANFHLARFICDPVPDSGGSNRMLIRSFVKKGLELMENTVPQIWTLIGMAVGWIVGGVALVLQIWQRYSDAKKSKSEIKNLDSQTDHNRVDNLLTYEEILQKANERASDIETRLTAKISAMQAQISSQETTISSLMAEIKLRDETIEKLTETNAKLQDWAERLVYQIRAFGEEPVPMEKPVRKKVKD